MTYTVGRRCGFSMPYIVGRRCGFSMTYTVGRRCGFSMPYIVGRRCGFSMTYIVTTHRPTVVFNSSSRGRTQLASNVSNGYIIIFCGQSVGSNILITSSGTTC